MAAPTRGQYHARVQYDGQKIEQRFPRSAGYDRAWMIENSMGPNAVWLTEFLCEVLSLQPGMKVLDHGCGRAMSSIFLAREFEVEVWANDLWIKAEDNQQRIDAAGCNGRIHPVHAEAHNLPYEPGFFDAIVSLDAYHYFGTDDLYIGYLTRFLKRGGGLGVVIPGVTREVGVEPPENLRKDWHWDFASFHSVEWWRRHWQRTGKVDIRTADWLPDGWMYWAMWDRLCAETRNEPVDESKMVAEDAGRNLGFVRLAAQRCLQDRWP